MLPKNPIIISQLYNLSEDLMYQAAAKIMNGVVGSPGTKTPIAPIETKILPKVIKIILISKYLLFLCFDLFSAIKMYKFLLNLQILNKKVLLLTSYVYKQ